jgi:hypothetical protein
LLRSRYGRLSPFESPASYRISLRQRFRLSVIETQAIKLIRGKPVAVPVPRENGAHDIYRCHKCQTAVWSDYGRRRNLRFVRVGTLDKPGTLKPDVHIFTRWKAKWLKLPKGIPVFRDYYTTSKLWPKGSFKRLNAALGR